MADLVEDPAEGPVEGPVAGPVADPVAVHVNDYLIHKFNGDAARYSNDDAANYLRGSYGG